MTNAITGGAVAAMVAFLAWLAIEVIDLGKARASHERDEAHHLEHFKALRSDTAAMRSDIRDIKDHLLLGFAPERPDHGNHD